MKESVINFSTISQAADRLGVSVKTLQRWEKLPGFPIPQRTPGGDRRYSDDNITSIILWREQQKKGYAVVTPQMGANQLGVSPRTFKRHFEDRQFIPTSEIEKLIYRTVTAPVVNNNTVDMSNVGSLGFPTTPSPTPPPPVIARPDSESAAVAISYTPLPVVAKTISPTKEVPLPQVHKNNSKKIIPVLITVVIVILLLLVSFNFYRVRNDTRSRASEGSYLAGITPTPTNYIFTPTPSAQITPTLPENAQLTPTPSISITPTPTTSTTTTTVGSLQSAYNNGGIIDTTDHDIVFNLTDSVTPANFLVNLKSSNNTLEVAGIAGEKILTLNAGNTYPITLSQPTNIKGNLLLDSNLIASQNITARKEIKALGGISTGIVGAYTFDDQGRLVASSGQFSTGLAVSGGNIVLGNGNSEITLNPGTTKNINLTNYNSCTLKTDINGKLTCGTDNVGLTGESDTLDSVTARGSSTNNSVTFNGGLSTTTLIASGATRLNGVAYTWPSTAGSTSYVLTSDGTGALTWQPSSSSFTETDTLATVTARGATTTDQPAFNFNSGSPFTVTNSTVVTNLNADQLDGYHANNLPYETPITVLPINKGGTNSTATPTNGGIAYGDGTGYAFTSIGSSGNILYSNGAAAPTWVDPASIGLSNFWQRTNGVVSPVNLSDSLLLGSTSTASAKFVANGLTGNTYIGGSATIAGSIVDVTSLNAGGMVKAMAPNGRLTLATPGVEYEVPLSFSAGVTRIGNAVTHTTGSGFNHIPVAGASTQMLQYSAAGTAKWVTVGGDATIADGGNITLSANSVDGTNISLAGEAIGNIMYFNGTDWVPLTNNTSGFVLSSGGLGGTPSWVALPPATTNYWQQNLGAISPANTSNAFLLGSTSTSSATFAVNSLTGDATMSGTLTVASLTGGVVHTNANGTLNISPVDLSTETTGTLSINHGGTNSTATPTNGGIAYGDGTRYQFTGTGGSGNILRSNGAAAPTWVDPATMGLVSVWAENNGALSPINITDSLNLGNTSTNSATVHLAGTTGENSFVNTGNFGIGMTNPGTALDVTGVGRFSTGITLTGGALSLTASSGSLALTGLGASSINSGANDINFTSGHFNTTVTGINSTAIGASTPSTGAFTTLSSTGTSNIGQGSGVVTINSSGALNMTAAAASTVTIANVVNSLNFDSNTLVIDALNNRVGVGMTNPTTALDVTGVGRFSTGLTLTGGALNLTSTSGTINATGLGASTISATSNNLTLSTVTTGTLALTSAGALNLSAGAASTITLANVVNSLNFDTNTFTIDALNNRVGIGLTNPAYALDVTGDINLTAGIRANGGFGNPGQVLSTTGTIAQWVDSASLVTNYWQKTTGSLAPADITNSFNLGNTSTNSATVHLAGTTAENSFVNTGNFGIGMTNPTTALDVTGTGRFSTGLTLTGGALNLTSTSGTINTTGLGASTISASSLTLTSAGALNSSAGAASTYTLANIVNSLNFDANTLTIDALNNRVGVGLTNPTSALDINGDINIIGYATASSSLAIGYTNAPAGPGNVILSGNLGIGLTNPTHPVDVLGSVNITGTYLVNGTPLSTSNWQRTLGSVAPLNITDSLNLGNTSTNSATVHLAGTTGENSFVNTGNLGIGLTNPLAKLDVTGNLNISTYATVGASLAIGYTNAPAGSGNAVFSGNVGIGLTNPLAPLTVAGAASVSGTFTIYNTPTIVTTRNQHLTLGDGNTGNIIISGYGALIPSVDAALNQTLGNTANTWSQLYLSDGIYNDAGTSTLSISTRRLTGSGDWAVNNGLRIGDTLAYGANFPADAGRKLEVVGNATISGTLATGATITVNNGNGKISAAVIDPPYTINGEKYATYMAGMIGTLKEETTGSIQTNEIVPGKGYRSVIAFNDQEKGSNLWLFNKTTSLSKHVNDMSVLLTPASSARTWYEVDKDNLLLYIYSSSPSVISYRLSAPRFDSANWTNFRDPNDVDGLVINDRDVQSASNIAESGMLNSPIYAPHITRLANGTYTIDQNNTPIMEQSSFFNSFIANLTAGAANIQETVTNRLTVNEKLISPLADIDQHNVIDATVSGTLYAEKIQSPSLDLLDSKYSTASAILAELQSKYQNYDSLLHTVLISATQSANLLATDTISPQNATPAGTFNELAINDLVVNSSFFTNSMNSLNTDLYIQPTKSHPLHLMADIMTINPDGQILINGNVEINGALTAQVITSQTANIRDSLQLGSNGFGALIASDNSGNLSLNLATSSASVNFAFSGDTPVASISANGLTVSKLNLSTSSSGQAVIPTGEKVIAVTQPNLTAESQVIVTFSGDYSPATKYWISLKPDMNVFEIHTDYPVATDTKAYYAIIN